MLLTHSFTIRDALGCGGAGLSHLALTGADESTVRNAQGGAALAQTGPAWRGSPEGL